MSALAIVAFFVALLAIILIHEFGHYLLARRFGFRVLEYFVGFGPKLWSFRRGEIEYGLKAIPAGGYVKIAGMNPFENDVPPGDEDRAYGAKPVRQRALVILAGPLSHFLVAAIIFSALLMTTGETDRTRVSVISDVPAELGPGVPSPAALAGLRPGDVITRVGDLAAPTPAEIGPYVAQHAHEAIPVQVKRGNEIVNLTITPVVLQPDTDQQSVRLGIELGPQPLGFFPAVAGGVADVAKYTRVSIVQIGHAFGPQGVVRVYHLLFEGAPRNQGDVASVVGVSQQVGAIGATGNWAAFFWVFAYVTLFIGIINLVPLPPFDGGHLAILLIEKARGRKIDMRKIVPVSAAVLLFLGFFVISTMVLDIWKPVPIGP
ncbi:MAG TPA: M50 family metallopeptidase [Actinomycetota bacterium]|nr:M50 family metallopeptidase [Actinomycetota bacterium]